MFIYGATYNSSKQAQNSEISIFCKSEKVDLEYLVYTLESSKKSSRK